MTDDERFNWGATEKGWRTKSGKIIPFNELSDEQLNKYYKEAQRKELVYANKSSVFYDKTVEMEEEARKRGIELEESKTEYHQNSKRLKGN